MISKKMHTKAKYLFRWKIANNTKKNEDPYAAKKIVFVI